MKILIFLLLFLGDFIEVYNELGNGSGNNGTAAAASNTTTSSSSEPQPAGAADSARYRQVPDKKHKRDSVARFFIPLFLVRNYLCAPNEQDHKVSRNFIFCEDTVFAKTCVCVVVDNEYFVSACSR